MGPEYQEQELFSFHSTSKGMIGECGRRGGYFECTNIDNAVLDQLYKMASINLCPNVHGQIMVDLMTNPPVKGDESYPQYKAEYDAIYESLGRRAIKLADSFNKLEGVTCNSAEGESCDEREKKELYGLNIAGDDGKEKETKKKEMYIHIY
jgi:alanine transaminase